MHVFSSTLYPQDIISYSPCSDFSATCYLQEASSSIPQAIQWIFCHSTQIFPSSWPNLTPLTTVFSLCTQDTMPSLNHFVISHKKVYVLAKNIFVQDRLSCPLYDFRCLHQHAQCETLLACLEIHHAISILYNSKWSSHI